MGATSNVTIRPWAVLLLALGSITAIACLLIVLGAHFSERESLPLCDRRVNVANSSPNDEVLWPVDAYWSWWPTGTTCIFETESHERVTTAPSWTLSAVLAFGFASGTAAAVGGLFIRRTEPSREKPGE